MLTHLDLNKILFLDIETVPLYADFNKVPAIEKEYFSEKTAYQRKNEISPEDFYTNAGIWAEFGRNCGSGRKSWGVCFFWVGHLKLPLAIF